MLYKKFYKNEFLVFSYFFQSKAYNKPPKITFSHQNNFFHWPSIRLIGKYQQNNSCGNWVLYTFFIRNNFQYFCTFFKLRLIISPSKLHFLTQFIFLHWPSIRLIGKYQQKSSCGNKVLYTIFYKKLFPVFRRESSFWVFLHICSISAKTTEKFWHETLYFIKRV